MIGIAVIVSGVLMFCCVYAIVTLSVNLQYGYTGISNLGLYLPIIIGVLTVGVLPGRLALAVYGLSNLDFVNDNAKAVALLEARLQKDPLTSVMLLVVTLIVVGGVSAFAGYLSGYPALRLPGDYLALFMLCLGESLRLFGMETMSLAGGIYGISIVNLFVFLGPYADLGVISFIMVSAAIAYIVCDRMCKSPLGRLLRSVRDNELTAQCVGKNVSLIKKKLLAITFAMLGVAGSLFALFTNAVVVEGYTRSDFSFWPWLMMVIGGTGNDSGGLLGTGALVIMRRVMIVSKNYFGFLPFDVLWLEPILLGAMLALVLIFRPAGILPEKAPHVKRPYPKTTEEHRT